MSYSKILDTYQTMLDKSGVTRRATADNHIVQNHLHLHQHREVIARSEKPAENAKRMFAAMERLREQANTVASR